MNKIKLQLLNDCNCFAMANAYFEAGFETRKGCFDLFFRRVPDNGGFAICAGLYSAIEYIKNLSFDDEDIEYLKQNYTQPIICIKINILMTIYLYNLIKKFYYT